MEQLYWILLKNNRDAEEEGAFDKGLIVGVASRTDKQ